MSSGRFRKNRIIYSLLLALCILGFWLFEQYYRPDPFRGTETAAATAFFPEMYLPEFEGGQIVHHDFYSLAYSEPHEQAAWVAYTLQPEHLSRARRKRPYYVEDPEVPTRSAAWWNYRGSDFNRGHLCPAGDRRFSERAYNQTFYTSNISPQHPDFNSGVWNRLEMQVRRWCKKYGKLYVITGGVLSGDLYSIGEEAVSVPEYFYKLVFRGEGTEISLIAFLIPNQPSEKPIEAFMVSVDELESRSGIDFYPQFSKTLQKRLESKEVHGNWEF
ncbi:DNA/RNA non-specific endonuclease [Robiginitalea sp. IMCC44478]|uniref:DNA/RNA non-specific endonuclease n=1 Tax=Robiginitalea sp. IMCC44478 TaxID=3459122 RepID=UPI0040423DBC